MENKTNIAELFKYCPKGMELDCTVYDNCILESVLEGELYPIKIQTPEGFMRLTKYGSLSPCTHSKCVIFPKGKTTWEGFVPPCKFKDGDVITCTNSVCSFVAIFKEMNTDTTFRRYVSLTLDDVQQQLRTEDSWSDFSNPRLATKEEKETLFHAIRDNGYKWNTKTKTLEKLPKDKFDITTLVPFESRVLVRCDERCLWFPAIFGFYKKDSKYFFVTSGLFYKQCIPYEGNEHLLGKTDDCDDFYKTWEE